MKKVIVMLFASAFALTAFAQAPKSDTAPKAPASAEKKTEKKAKSKAKTEKKSKSKAKAEKKAETK